MAEQAAGDTIFVYLGGEQEVPADVTHVVIDRSVKIIPMRAFYGRQLLVSMEIHDGVEKIERLALGYCMSLRGIKLPGVKIVGHSAFKNCRGLSYVEFGDKLETIEANAFHRCSLRKIKIPTVRTIGVWAFSDCHHLTDVELPAVERIGEYAFTRCDNLQRIAIPLTDDMFPLDTDQFRCTQFDECAKLTAVDLVGGGIHKTIASLRVESWKDEMKQEINRINQLLPNTYPCEKTDAIQRWIRSVIHYKNEHNRLLKEATTLLELAVWKAKLDEVMAHSLKAQPAKKAMIDMESVRKERRVTSGADIIIRNVLPFLSFFLE